MTNKIWTPQEVENYLQGENQKGNRLILPEDAFCTENFTWNEVLQTKNRNISMPSEKILNNLHETAKVVQIFRTEIGTFEVSMKKEKDKKENLLKKLKSLIKKLQALFEEYQQGQKNSETNNNPTNYVYEDRVNEQSKKSQNTAPEDDGLVVIPDKYKDKSNGENAEEPQLPYKKRVEIKAYSPDGELIKESNDSEDQEPEINPEYLKPIELEEDGMATGGAAGISDKFVNPNYIGRNSAENLADEEDLSGSSSDNEIDFFKTSMKELMKHQRSFRYDAKGGKEYSVSTISRKLDEITKTLDGIQKQLDYHEKVVNIYNTPELAEFYLNRPVRNIMKSVFEDYCLMEGIEITR